MGRIEDLRKVTNELQMQAEIKKNLLESDNRYGKPTMEAMAKLSGQILDNEKKLLKLKNLDKTAEKLSLEKQIEKLQKSGLNAMNKALGLDKQILGLQKKAKSDSVEEIKNAKKYASLLEDINSGNKDMSDILSTIAEDDFGSLNNQAEELATMLLADKDIMKDLGKERKFADMIDQVKDTLGLVDLKKTLTMAGALAAITSFLGKALEVKQTLGTSAGESARIAGNMTAAGAAAKMLGGNAQEAQAAVTAMVDEFGTLNVLSLGTSISLGKMVADTGLTGANAAKLLKSMESISTASIETNMNLISSTAALARAEGVAPAQVLNDIAENTETFALFAKDGGKNIAKAAIEARKLGLNLATVAGIADNLLDFESSIEKEMEASMLLGRQMSLDKARELALTGDLAGLAAEVTNQVGSQAEFEAMNVVQRKALAAAIGVSATDLGKMVAGEKTSAEMAEEKNKQQMKFIGLQKLAANAGIIQAVASITAGFGKFGPLGFGLAAGAIASLYGAISSAPKLEKGGVVTQSGMAQVHKGEAFSGTRNEMGMGMGKTNILLKQLIKQNEVLMNRLTNRVGDIALSSAT